MLAAYFDIRKVSGTPRHEALWDIIRLRGILAKIVSLLTSLFSGTENAVKRVVGESIFFPVNAEVRQGCILASSLFNICMDWVLGTAVDWVIVEYLLVMQG